MNANGAPRLRIGVIGCGKVGAVLGAAMRAAGHSIVATSAISEASLERAEAVLPGVAVLPELEVARAADVIFLTVPDDAIGTLVSGLDAQNAWDGGKLAIHTSGFHGVDVLQPVVDRGGDGVAMHPAMTFTGTELDLPRLMGTPFAITASVGADFIAEALVYDLGGEPLPIAEADRAEYHAALAHSANHLVTLIAQSQQMLRNVGIDDPSRILRPLLEAALENGLQRGDKALTGPIARGDVATVRAHLDVTDGLGGDIAIAYRAMAHATWERARARHTLPAETEKPMHDLFKSDGQGDRND